MAMHLKRERHIFQSALCLRNLVGAILPSALAPLAWVGKYHVQLE